MVGGGCSNPIMYLRLLPLRVNPGVNSIWDPIVMKFQRKGNTHPSVDKSRKSKRLRPISQFILCLLEMPNNETNRNACLQHNFLWNRSHGKVHLIKWREIVKSKAKGVCDVAMDLKFCKRIPRLGP